MRERIAKYTPTIVGILLLWSGVYKVFQPGEATYALLSLDALHKFAGPVILLITAVEIYLGILLLMKCDLQYSISLCTVVLFIFSVFLWYLFSLAHPPACGCMGLTKVFKNSKQAALFGLFRNCAILWCLKVSHGYYRQLSQGRLDEKPVNLAQVNVA